MAITERWGLRDRCNTAVQCAQEMRAQRSAERLSYSTTTSFSTNSTVPAPTVTIGLPVYNGENFLAEAIESVLSQTFEDYELVICDNASTDRTEEICRRYARQDKRVRYHRNVRNWGPAWNYNRTFELSRGRYFKWAAHDDVFAPTLIEKLVAQLDQYPEAVLAFCEVDIIDEVGALKEPYAVEMQLDSDSPAQRFQEMISLKHRCYEVFGLVRTEVLAHSALIGAYAGSDRVLLSWLSLQGPFKTVAEPLFSAREHAQQSIAMLRQPRSKLLRMHDYAVWFDPSNKGKVLFPNWRILFEYIAAIGAAPVGVLGRLSCIWVLLQWLLTYRNVAKLGRDVMIAIAQIVGRAITSKVVADEVRAAESQAASTRGTSDFSSDFPSDFSKELIKVNNGSLKS